MSVPQNTIALIFDFDDTLTDDSTTRFLEQHGVSAKSFWGKDVKKRVDSEWDPTIAYLDLFLEYVGPGKPLGKLTNKELKRFGSSLGFYEGIPELFQDLEALVAEHRISHPSIEFYIISGGIEEIIKGSSIARYFSGIWGCTFAERDGQIAKIKNLVSFTEKTKYLFFINKGFGDKARSDQYSVNMEVQDAHRRIPLDHMIYVGDGLTDVPCFSLITSKGGKAFGVFNPTQKDSPKKAWEQLVAPRRVSSMNSPKYGERDDLGSLIRAAVSEICIRLDLKTQSAV